MCIPRHDYNINVHHVQHSLSYVSYIYKVNIRMHTIKCKHLRTQKDALNMKLCMNSAIRIEHHDS